MGKVIRSCRKGKGSVFKAHTTGRKGPVAMKKADFAERHGYIKGVVKEILHDSGRGAPLARIQFKDAYRFKRINTTMVAPEGMHTGQFIYSGKKGKLQDESDHYQKLLMKIISSFLEWIIGYQNGFGLSIRIKNDVSYYFNSLKSV